MQRRFFSGDVGCEEHALGGVGREDDLGFGRGVGEDCFLRSEVEEGELAAVPDGEVFVVGREREFFKEVRSVERLEERAVSGAVDLDAGGGQGLHEIGDLLVGYIGSELHDAERAVFAEPDTAVGGGFPERAVRASGGVVVKERAGFSVGVVMWAGRVGGGGCDGSGV